MAREQTIYSELALGLGVLGFSAADVAELQKIENVEKNGYSFFAVVLCISVQVFLSLKHGLSNSFLATIKQTN